MSSAHSMNARKCVHAQKPCPSQAFAHESSKVGGKRETGETEARRLMERKAAQQKKKNTSEELKQGLPKHNSGFNPLVSGGRITTISINLHLFLL